MFVSFVAMHFEVARCAVPAWLFKFHLVFGGEDGYACHSQ